MTHGVAETKVPTGGETERLPLRASSREQNATPPGSSGDGVPDPPRSRAEVPSPVPSLEALQQMPDAALIAIGLATERQHRLGADGNHDVGTTAAAEQALDRAQRDPASNPGLVPLSLDERAFAADVLLDFDHQSRSLEASYLQQRDAAWQTAVDSGRFVTVPAVVPPRLDEPGMDQARRLKAMKEAMEPRERQRAELAQRLGKVGEDWLYCEVSVVGRTFMVFTTKGASPEVFALSGAMQDLPKSRDAWLRTFFATRSRTRPASLPPRK